MILLCPWQGPWASSWMTFCKNSIRISFKIIFVNKHYPNGVQVPFTIFCFCPGLNKIMAIIDIDVLLNARVLHIILSPMCIYPLIFDSMLIFKVWSGIFTPNIFSAHELSVVRCPSVDNFSHFRLLLWNRWMEFNETCKEARSRRPLPSLCFFRPIGKTRWRPWPLIGWDIFDFSSETTEQNSTKLVRKQDLNVLYQVCVFRADRKNKMAAVASDWLRHLRLFLSNRWTEFNETCKEAISWRPLPSLCFSGRSEKQDGRRGLWLAEIFSTSPLKPLNGIQRNLSGSKISTSSTKFVFFRRIGKTRWPSWPLIGWDIFDFSYETTERNSTKLVRKQDLNVLYQVCVFQADRKNKMAVLASDRLRHFRLLLWNHWTEFN